MYILFLDAFLKHLLNNLFFDIPLTLLRIIEMKAILILKLLKLLHSQNEAHLDHLSLDLVLFQHTQSIPVALDLLANIRELILKNEKLLIDSRLFLKQRNSFLIFQFHFQFNICLYFGFQVKDVLRQVLSHALTTFT